MPSISKKRTQNLPFELVAARADILEVVEFKDAWIISDGTALGRNSGSLVGISCTLPAGSLTAKPAPRIL